MSKILSINDLVKLLKDPAFSVDERHANLEYLLSKLDDDEIKQFLIVTLYTIDALTDQK